MSLTDFLPIFYSLLLKRIKTTIPTIMSSKVITAPIIIIKNALSMENIPKQNPSEHESRP